MKGSGVKRSRVRGSGVRGGGVRLGKKSKEAPVQLPESNEYWSRQPVHSVAKAPVQALQPVEQPVCYQVNFFHLSFFFKFQVNIF